MILTIAMPVYNGEKYIRNAIESCLNQDCGFEYEVLIVDNASTDGTQAILADYAGRAVIVRNKKTVTMFENHNVCLQKATGKYVLFCHADDLLCYHALRILQTEIEACGHPEKFVVWGRSMYGDFSPLMRISGIELNQMFSGVQSVKPFLYSGLPPAGSCFSRESMLACGGFVFCGHRLCPNDWITMMLLAVKGFEFKMIGRLYYLRKFSSTLPAGTSLGNRLESYVDAISELVKVLDEWELEAIQSMAMELKYPPLDFLYGCVKNGISTGRFRWFLFKRACLNPYVAADPRTLRMMLHL